MSRPQIAKHMFPRDLPVWATFYRTKKVNSTMDGNSMS